MKVYVVFGEHSEEIAKVLSSEFDVIGYDRKLDTAVASAEKMGDAPDVFVILGSALVTGITEGGLNYGKVLLENLKKLRTLCPKSNIKLIISNKVGESVISGVIALGIYDFYRVDKLSVTDLPDIIKTEKDFSSCSEDAKIAKTEQGDLDENKVAVVTGDEKEDIRKKNPLINLIKDKFIETVRDSSLLKVIGEEINKCYQQGKEGETQDKFIEKVPTHQETPDNQARTARGFSDNTKLKQGTLKIPIDFVAMGDIPGALCCSNISEVEAASPSVILVPTSHQVEETIKALRRKFTLSKVPVIVVGQADEKACYAAGADECIINLDEDAVDRIRARAARMKEVWEKAVKDDLTGLYKRNFLDDYLAEQEQRYRLNGVKFSLMICDLDHFKQVNDTYGHPAGDAVLKQFAQYLTAKVRETDVITRYGGEEFVIVFPCTENARSMADRLCREWSQTEISLPGGRAIRSTFSAGLAVIGRDDAEAGEIISVADHALYKAKRSGRNRVVSANENIELPVESPPEVPVVEVEAILQRPNIAQSKENEGVSPQITLANGCTVIAVCSPFGASGSSSFASLLAKKLAENTREKISALDCDLEGRGLGLRMGMKLIDLENRDWRRNGVPLDFSGVRTYPLNPSSEQSATESMIIETLQRASLGTDKLVIDLGSNMKSWWFRRGHETAHVILWVVRNDPLLLEKAKSNWKDRSTAGCREFLILIGEGTPRDIEEIFMLPCYQVTEKKGFKQVKAILKDGNLRRGRKVLVVGFKKIPVINGLVLDAFSKVDEAVEWIKYNVPDVAVLASDLNKISLIEYDLKKLGIPTKKAIKKELVDILTLLKNSK